MDPLAPLLMGKPSNIEFLFLDSKGLEGNKSLGVCFIKCSSCHTVQQKAFGLTAERLTLMLASKGQPGSVNSTRWLCSVNTSFLQSSTLAGSNCSPFHSPALTQWEENAHTSCGRGRALAMVLIPLTHTHKKIPPCENGLATQTWH